MTDKIKILVVDDLPEKLLVYQTILEELNEEVVLARSASEALMHLLQDDFAVIILDVNMPEMDGFEAAALIRARKRCAHTPIIFITAYVDELHAMKGYSYGAVDYILSPVNPDVLRTKVRVFVDLFRKNLEVHRQGEVLRELQEREHRRLLHETNERLRLALDAGSMGACEWDLGANLLSWSPTIESIFGYAPGEFTGAADELSSRLHPEDRQRVLDTMTQSVQAGSDFCIEHRIIRPNREVAWVELRGKVFADEHGRPARFTGVCMDITQRKAVEGELRRHREMLEELVRHRTAELEASYQRLQLADRLASIGTLAAGLGHDMGNLLLPVRVRLDSLDQRIATMKGLDKSWGNQAGQSGAPQATTLRSQAAGASSHLDSALDDIKAIRTACDYLNRLSQGLRLFALDPEKPGSAEATDLLAWWCDVESFLRNSLPKHVALECRMPASLPPIDIPPHAFTQAIYNLVQNAGDAMRDQPLGRVVLSASVRGGTDGGAGASGAAVHDDPLAAPASGSPRRPAQSRARNAIVISISDDGPGMNEDVRQRCMEPFFSTKTRQISTGLGLALVRGTIYNAGGSIQIDSAPGRGTTFRLTIPLAERGLRRRLEPGAEPQAAHVIMGDQRLHAFVKSLLEGFGMRVNDGEWSATSAAHLLVYDNPNGRWHEVQAFLAKDHRRRAIILSEDPSADAHPQVLRLAARPSPVLIRKAISEAIRSQQESDDVPAAAPVGAAV
jgi:PAS domain S-box-containing protein